MSASKPVPTLSEEKALWAAGHRLVAGVDEVGRGSWAGPLTVGVVVVPADRRIYKLRDSKALSEKRREDLYDKVVGWVDDWAIGHASNHECDRLGMSAAQKLAARRALDGLRVSPDAVLVDGKWDFVDDPTTRMIVKGDTKCLSIAAASILAKVTRDRMMRAEAENFPAYNFESNKGYPCAKQIAAISGYGPTVLHRRSWAFMDSMPWSYFDRLDPQADQDQMNLFAG